MVWKKLGMWSKSAVVQVMVYQIIEKMILRWLWWMITVHTFDIFDVGKVIIRIRGEVGC